MSAPLSTSNIKTPAEGTCAEEITVCPSFKIVVLISMPSSFRYNSKSSNPLLCIGNSSLYSSDNFSPSFW